MEGPTFESFTSKLKNFKIIVKNMVCYLSRRFSLFALNYGRDVSEFDAAAILGSHARLKMAKEIALTHH